MGPRSGGMGSHKAHHQHHHSSSSSVLLESDLMCDLDDTKLSCHASMGGGSGQGQGNGAHLMCYDVGVELFHNLPADFDMLPTDFRFLEP